MYIGYNDEKVMFERLKIKKEIRRSMTGVFIIVLYDRFEISVSSTEEDVGGKKDGMPPGVEAEFDVVDVVEKNDGLWEFVGRFRLLLWWLWAW